MRKSSCLQLKRDARLQQIQDRLAAESAVEREARLQRMRINPSEKTGC